MKKNINQILDNIFNIKIYFLFWLIVLSFLLRLATVYFARDTHIGHEQEWGILFENLINYKSYSYYIFNDQLIPSVFMPPMYPFFLYLLKVITSFEGENLVYLIIFVQIILSTYSVYIFYQINQNFFSNKLSFINSIIFSIVPLNVYACGQISSVSLQIIFSLLFIKFLLLIIKKQTMKNILIFSIVSGPLNICFGTSFGIFAEKKSECSFSQYISPKSKTTFFSKIFTMISHISQNYSILFAHWFCAP